MDAGRTHRDPRRGASHRVGHVINWGLHAAPSFGYRIDRCAWDDPGRKVTPDVPPDSGSHRLPPPPENPQSLAMFYVQRTHDVEDKAIPPGTYRLQYTSGLDWDGENREFSYDPYYGEIVSRMDFQETRTEEQDTDGVHIRTRSSIISITLHRVRGRTAKTTAISKANFRRLQ